MKGFTKLLRAELKNMGHKGVEISATQLAVALDLTTRQDKKPLYRTIQDFVVRGELKRVKPGVYKYIGKTSKNELKSVMWRLLRARKVVTIDDLEELSGASREYVKEWLRMLEKRDLIRRFKDGRCRLVNDIVIEPENADKATKYRELRKKKAVLTALDQASNALETAKSALMGIDVEKI